MNIVVCVDNSFGMLFNNRRQSKDSVLTNYIVEISGESRLLAGEFSRSLFESCNFSDVVIDNEFLEIAEKGDFCFVENCLLTPYNDKIDKIYICKWNRNYPSDFIFDIDISEWSLKSSTDLTGSSHEKITVEVYEK